MSVNSGIHDYLGSEHIFYLFQILAKEDPFHLIRCESVCSFWRDLTNENYLWKDLAKRLGVESDQKSSLRKIIAKTIAEARTAIANVQEQKLLTYDEKRAFYYNSLVAQIQNLPPGEEKRQKERTLEKLRVSKNQRIEVLKAACEGHIKLSLIALGSRSEALRIAQLLSTDKYLEKEPLKKLEKLKTND